MSVTKLYYTYAYLREDGTPYYIGKGTKDRAYNKNHRIKTPSKNRIKILQDGLTNDEAMIEEIRLISLYGRKDLGTGILRNMTAGGDGSPGRVATKDQREKQREKMIGRVSYKMTQEQKGAVSKRMKDNLNHVKHYTLKNSNTNEVFEVINLKKWCKENRVIYTNLVSRKHAGGKITGDMYSIL
jgi:hypothetical protein